MKFPTKFPKKLYPSLVGVSLILLMVCVTDVTPDSAATEQPSKDAEEYHFSCKKIVFRIVKKVVNVFGICSKELKEKIPDDKERSKYIQCSVKCTLQRLGFVDNSTGAVTDAHVDNFLDLTVKPQFHEVGRIVMGGCIEDFQQIPLESLKDEYCEPYGNMVKCMQNVLSEVC